MPPSSSKRKRACASDLIDEDFPDEVIQDNPPPDGNNSINDALAKTGNDNSNDTRAVEVDEKVEFFSKDELDQMISKLKVTSSNSTKINNLLNSDRFPPKSLKDVYVFRDDDEWLIKNDDEDEGNIQNSNTSQENGSSEARIFSNRQQPALTLVQKFQVNDIAKILWGPGRREINHAMSISRGKLEIVGSNQSLRIDEELYLIRFNSCLSAHEAFVKLKFILNRLSQISGPPNMTIKTVVGSCLNPFWRQNLNQFMNESDWYSMWKPKPRFLPKRFLDSHPKNLVNKGPFLRFSTVDPIIIPYDQQTEPDVVVEPIQDDEVENNDSQASIGNDEPENDYDDNEEDEEEPITRKGRQSSKFYKVAREVSEIKQETKKRERNKIRRTIARQRRNYNKDNVPRIERIEGVSKTLTLEHKQKLIRERGEDFDSSDYGDDEEEEVYYSCDSGNEEDEIDELDADDADVEASDLVDEFKKQKKKERAENMMKETENNPERIKEKIIYTNDDIYRHKFAPLRERTPGEVI